jgi:tetratricopeptide (TPR) repeat protein
MKEPTTPEELQWALFQASRSADAETMMRLVNDYDQVILQNFAQWARVPEQLREDHTEVEAYGRFLMLVARLFERAGMPTLMERLAGNENNPIIRWRNSFNRAEQLGKSGDLTESNQLLFELIDDMKGAEGSAIDDYRPKILGLIGSNYFHLGNADEALRYTKAALEECRRSGDASGVRIYTENLQVLSVAASADSLDEKSVRVRRIRASIARAQDLSDEARYDLSNSILEEVLAEIGLSGKTTGAEYRGKVFGLLGLNCYRLANYEPARTYTENALKECSAAEDADGIRVYTANLAAIAKASA